MKYVKLSSLIILLFSLQLFSVYSQSKALQLVSTLIFGVTLAIAFINYTRLKGRFHKRMFAGILFSIAASTLLLLKGDIDNNRLIYASVPMLLCHICYTSAFYLDFKSAPELDKKGARIAIITVFLGCLSCYFYFRPHLGSSRVPFLAYLITISFMMMMASFRNLRVNKQSFTLILMGSTLFLLSDVMTTSYLFLNESIETRLLSTATFMAAQYLIVLGGIERQLIHKD